MVILDIHTNFIDVEYITELKLNEDKFNHKKDSKWQKLKWELTGLAA